MIDSSGANEHPNAVELAKRDQPKEAAAQERWRIKNRTSTTVTLYDSESDYISTADAQGINHLLDALNNRPAESCTHEWVEAENEFLGHPVTICKKCMIIRPAESELVEMDIFVHSHADTGKPLSVDVFRVRGEIDFFWFDGAFTDLSEDDQRDLAEYFVTHGAILDDVTTCVVRKSVEDATDIPDFYAEFVSLGSLAALDGVRISRECAEAALNNMKSIKAMCMRSEQYPTHAQLEELEKALTQGDSDERN